MDKLHSSFFEYLVVSLDEIGARSHLFSGIFYFVEEQVILLFQFHRRLEIIVKLLHLDTFQLLNRLIDFLVDFVCVDLFTLQTLFLQVLFIHFMILDLLIF